ncbi:hypothetical protein ALC62_01133 [Cyphomyrmex costatus]|uniref:Uncharacterized protein n=1 Tax=Cyphomyrmex costatus TaxID=456900 RepID=A0A195D527_9HYME|nr:hypothetical protein ALC62_01133 [Cyphomyrmex costatus]
MCCMSPYYFFFFIIESFNARQDFHKDSRFRNCFSKNFLYKIKDVIIWTINIMHVVPKVVNLDNKHCPETMVYYNQNNNYVYASYQCCGDGITRKKFSNDDKRPVGPGGPYSPGPMYSVLGKLALYGPTGPEAAPVGNGGGIPLNRLASYAMKCFEYEL